MLFIRKGSLVRLTELGKKKVFTHYPGFGHDIFNVGEVFLILEPPTKVEDENGCWLPEWQVTVLWGDKIFRIIHIACSGESFEDYLQVVQLPK